VASVVATIGFGAGFTVTPATPSASLPSKAMQCRVKTTLPALVSDAEAWPLVSLVARKLPLQKPAGFEEAVQGVFLTLDKVHFRLVVPLKLTVVGKAVRLTEKAGGLVATGWVGPAPTQLTSPGMPELGQATKLSLGL